MKKRAGGFLLISSMVGAFCGELLGIVLLMISNGNLLSEQKTITLLGYIAVPGQFLFSEMKAFTTYLAGGLFFALTIGLAYGFCCGLIFWLFSRYQKKGYHYVRLLPFVIFLIVLLLTKRGSDPFVFLFFLLVPLILWFLSSRILSTESFCFIDVIRYGLIFIVFLFLLCVTLWNHNFINHKNYSINFIEVRDRLLLPTNLGQKIDKFYYHYTLYPARLIKPLNNRLQNVIDLDPQGFPKAKLRQIRAVLKRYDWFPAVSDSNSDSYAKTTLTMGEDESQEIFFHWHKKPVYNVPYEEFLKAPSEHLKKYSERIYPFDPLRVACGISLFIIIPLALSFWLFMCCIGFIRLVLSLFPLNITKTLETFIISGIILIVFGVLIFGLKPKTYHPRLIAFDIPGLKVLIFSLKPKTYPPEDIAELWLIAKGQAQGDRISALHHLDKSLAPRSYQMYQEEIVALINDPAPVIRRFGAEFMGKLAVYNKTKAKNDEIFPLLFSLLQDSNINVVYTAAGAIGKLRTPQAKEILLDILDSNREWYLKMKAYFALKKIGWRQ